MTDVAIRTEKLTRRFGNLVAVDGMDLQVTAGQFFGFLGPNECRKIDHHQDAHWVVGA